MGSDRSSKRGNAAIEIATVLIVLLVLSVITITAYTALKDVNTDTQGDTTLSNETKAQIQASTTQYPVLMDNLIVMVLIIIWLVLIVSSYFVGSNTSYLPILIILILVICVGMTLAGSAIEEVLLSGELYASSFPSTMWIVQHLGYIILPFLLSIGVAMYAGSRT